jgi:hypothetical protein
LAVIDFNLRHPNLPLRHLPQGPSDLNSGQTIFSQFMGFLPLHEFRECVRRYRGDWRVHKFSCLDQFLAMAFAQLTSRESLRDVEACLRVMKPKLYHMGFRGRIARSTMADANELRDWRIFHDFAHVLIAHARSLYSGDSIGIELESTAYAFDSTVIDLCLSLFPWAKFRKHKAAIKLHTLLDLRGSIPSFIAITEGRMGDARMLDELPVESGAIYVMDRGYLACRRLYRMAQANAYFITRAKNNTCFRRQTSAPVDKSTGLRFDQTGFFSSQRGARGYPAKLRRIRYYDAENDLILDFLTNNFDLPALAIARLYRLRWKVELFFKWIKQHLRIKAFLGTSDNAVKTQIWIAIAIYVLILIMKKQLAIRSSPYTILQILSVSLFEKIPILLAMAGAQDDISEPARYEQLSFLNF